MKKTSLLLIVLLILTFPGFAQKQITIDFNTSNDSVKNLLGGNKLWDNTMELLHDEGIEQIRIHDYHDAGDYCFYSDFWNTDNTGNFTTINADFNPDNPSHYNWTATDEIVDQILSNNFEVFFRIGVSYPNPGIPPMAPYDPPYNSVTDPLNFSRFASLSSHTVKHYNKLWDNGFAYNIKYWEIWNEPGGLFWDGSILQFYKMYKAVSDSMKYADNSILVGGPAGVVTTSIGIQPDYRENFIEYCNNNNAPLDFYSWHIYNARNPYGLKSFADTIRNILDINGYPDAQSIISEINLELATGLDTVKDSPFGAAYYLSLVLTMQEAPMDKLLWYPSACHVMNFGGDTISSRSFYAMKSMKLLQTETPIKVDCSGNEVIENNWNADTTNLMVFAGKSTDNSKLYLLVSNLKSDKSDFNINLINLPWTNQDSIRIIKNEITATERYTQSETTVTGNSTISIIAQDYNSPSVLFYRIEKVVLTNKYDNEADKITFTNPVSSVLTFKNVSNSSFNSIDIIGINGQKVISTKFQRNLVVSELKSGIYLIIVKNIEGKIIFTSKFQKK